MHFLKIHQLCAIYIPSHAALFKLIFFSKCYASRSQTRFTILLSSLLQSLDFWYWNNSRCPSNSIDSVIKVLFGRVFPYSHCEILLYLLSKHCASISIVVCPLYLLRSYLTPCRYFLISIHLIPIILFHIRIQLHISLISDLCKYPNFLSRLSSITREFEILSRYLYQFRRTL